MRRRPRGVVASACVFLLGCLTLPVSAGDIVDWRWRTPTQPCGGDCAGFLFMGKAVSTNVQDIFFKVIPPWNWSYDASGIVGGAVSRRIVTLFKTFDVEGEAGIAQRFGNQDDSEIWGALYLRYTAFPWNDYLTTTAAMSIGLNYATGVSDFEKEHSKLDPPGGTHVMHYFSPEITFALPEHRERQLVLRLHHRSGAYGIVSGASSGATYMSIGVRSWF